MIKIRSVESKDLKKIMILEQGTFKENAFSELLMEKLIERNFFFLKLEDDDIIDEIIGFIIVVRDRIDRVNIINFLIRQKYQGKGYGTLLLGNTLEKIKQFKEIKKVVLNVQISNSPAIKLYEKLHFIKHPKKIKNYYQSGESAFLMELDIDSL